MAYTTIDDGSAYFQTAIYSGTGSNQSITNDGNSDLQPDFVWVKCRQDDSGAGHRLTDSSRLSSGAPTLTLQANSNAVEFDDNVASGSAATTAFNSDGFSIGTNGNYNTDGDTYVAWQWKANGGSRTTFSESSNNPAGGYQANTTAGFSIIDYTGTLGDSGGGSGTFAHGLNSAPTWWVVKPRVNVSDNQWFVCHQGLASDYATDFIHFDTTGAKQDNALMWNDTAPTNSVITVGSKPGTNNDGSGFICYAWHDVQGFSKFGSYTGNGIINGPVIYTGFKPAWIMIKCTSQTEPWFIVDTKRSTTNPTNEALVPNDSSTENTTAGYNIDILSYGFKCRGDSGQQNEDGGNYIYMAFAEHPFVSSKGVPTTAR
jgi:hypothetical protein